MALRLVEMVLPVRTKAQVDELLKDQHADVMPLIPLPGDRMLLRLVLEAEEAEALTERFKEGFGALDDFRINLMALEATIPEHKSTDEVEKAKEKEEKAKEKEEKAKEKMVAPAAPPPGPVEVVPAGPGKPSQRAEAPPSPPPLERKGPPEKKPEKKEKKTRSRISKDELYTDMRDAAKLNSTYLVLVALSVGVAAVGLVQDNVAVIIGAMVIAPLLAPNVALCLATTLANGKLAARALLVLCVGIALALALSFVLGVALDVDPALPEIASRTKVSLGDVAVALAAGAAAALFVSLGTGTALVGVTVAVALLPPLVVTGLLLGAGEVELAKGSLLLLVCNLIGINLAGTLVFIAKGVWPSSWWEEKKAKRTALLAMTVWTVLLLFLVFILLLTEGIVELPWDLPFLP